MTIDEARPAGPDPPPDSEQASTDAAPAPKKRHLTKGILILMLLTVLGVVAPFIAYVFSHKTGSGLDITSVFTLRIRNDSAAPLTVRNCPANCPGGELTLPAGASVQVRASSRGSLTPYYLFDSSGRPVGCLPRSFTKEVSEVLVSQQQPCPALPSP